jgi:transposase-like protein
MNTRYIAEEYRLSHWAGIMQDRKESGLSIKSYCASAGIHTNVYYYWQRKLRETASRDMLSPKEPRPQSIVPSGWAVVSEPTLEPSSQSSEVMIEIGKFRVSAGNAMSPEHLEQILRVLIKLC